MLISSCVSPIIEIRNYDTSYFDGKFMECGQIKPGDDPVGICVLFCIVDNPDSELGWKLGDL